MRLSTAGGEVVELGALISPSPLKVDPTALPTAPYIGLEHIEQGLGAIRGHGTSGDVRSTKAVFHRGDLLYGKLRPYLNKVWLAQFDGVCSTDILVYPESPRADSAFLKYRLMAPDFVAYASGHSNGVNLPRVNAKALSRFSVRLPGLDEQRRMAAEIEKQFTRLDAGVASLRRVQANLKRYRAAVLKAACEGRLVPTEAELSRKEGRNFESADGLLARILGERRQGWLERDRYKEPRVPKAINLPHSPEGWMWVALDAVIAAGPQNGVYLPRNLYGGGTPILRIDDYQNGWVRCIDELNKVQADRETVRKYQLRPGDLVINRVNSPTHLGKCLVVRHCDEGALFESNMMRARLTGFVNPRYVELYLRSHDGRHRLTSGAKWAVNQASINQEDVKRTPLPLPPAKEQDRIVAEVERCLSALEELETTVVDNLQRAARLRQATLQNAFTGEQ